MLHKHLHTNVHSSITCDSKKGETSPLSINRQMDQQNVVYPNNGIYFIIKRNEVHICDTTWTGAENVVPGEQSQIPKATFCRILLI